MKRASDSGEMGDNIGEVFGEGGHKKVPPSSPRFALGLVSSNSAVAALALDPGVKTFG